MADILVRNVEATVAAQLKKMAKAAGKSTTSPGGTAHSPQPSKHSTPRRTFPTRPPIFAPTATTNLRTGSGGFSCPTY